MKDYPPISCFCCTLSRPAGMLDEAVYSFLTQDYPGHKELLIFNNDPKQTVIFDHPQVTIVNCERQGASLGAMMNEAVSLCKYDLIAVWEDDDISLPWRLSLSAQNLAETGFFCSHNAWYMEYAEIKSYHSSLWHSAWLYSRELFDRALKYSDADIEVGFDWELWERFYRLGCRHDPNTEGYYIYRWGTGSMHLSGFGQGLGKREDALRLTEDQRAKGEVVSGEVRLVPTWKQDYVAQAKQWVVNHAK